MRRIIKVNVQHADGSQQDQLHESADDPTAVARFITGITDDQPGQDFTFTIRSDREPHDRR